MGVRSSTLGPGKAGVMGDDQASRRPLTTLELTLLGLAAQEPRSGYDIKSLFESTALRQFSASPGSIYPALKRLEARGSLVSELEDSPGDRSRRVYSLSEQGWEELRVWLARDPSVQELEQDPRLPILRFSLLGTIRPSIEQADHFLRCLEESARRYAEDLEGVAQTLRKLDDPYPALALDHGRAGLLTTIDWARRTRGALSLEV